MARDKSSVLTPADKKAVVNDVKAKLKDAKTLLKTINTESKTAAKALVASEKRAGAQTKVVQKLEAELAAITGK